VLEFNASVLRRESPVGLGVLFVSLSLPSGNLLGKELFVGDSAVEALGGKNAEFGLCQVEPAAVLRGVMPFETLDQTTRFFGWESFVK
jgi:hypothetical protein